jgi:CYTH domain-containing protein
MQEIERKFLVSTPPAEIIRGKGTPISQGYLAASRDEEVRLRKKGEAFTLTVKRGRGGIRQETEVDLNREQFRRLWPLTEGRRIAKTRYERPWGNRIIELDVYHEELSGLMTAEVEFPDRESADAFPAPHWFGREVTTDARFKNKALAERGLTPHWDGSP